MSERPHRLATVVIALWLALQASLLVRGLLPLPRPYGIRLPWRMFSEPAPIEATVRAEGLTAGGEWVPIPLERWFRHTRGATGERAYDYSKIVLEPGRQEGRQAFADWLAARMAEDGVSVVKVRLVKGWRDLRDGSSGETRIGQYRVGDGGE